MNHLYNDKDNNFVVGYIGFTWTTTPIFSRVILSTIIFWFSYLHGAQVEIQYAISS